MLFLPFLIAAAQPFALGQTNQIERSASTWQQAFQNSGSPCLLTSGIFCLVGGFSLLSTIAGQETAEANWMRVSAGVTSLFAAPFLLASGMRPLRLQPEATPLLPSYTNGTIP